ncbi:DNA polymerase [Tetrabaena socialis]|uniref:DNA polymerase delta catalytic subunit n=1 Tax=Tetrabaena socialis TaxID=47790 RepID=A0A2J8AJ34_9CHLO|nr:DNA polymerase [Tetrabaena socialis]|eukprot:PNH12525.1 DNA polymerase [Tetrabaena socialis]
MAMKRSDMYSGADRYDPEQDLEFQALSWYSGDEEVDDEEEEEGDANDTMKDNMAFVIRVFGVTAQGRSVALAIRSFTPHFYIKVDTRWTPGQTRALKERILSDQRINVIQVRSVSKKDFYGFRNDQQEAFMRIDFKSVKGMRFMASKLQKGLNGRGLSFAAGEISLYESNIEPMIRFMHIRDVLPAGWLRVARRDLSQCNESRCDASFGTNWMHVHALKQRQDSAPFLVASFDIECNSSHGDFPTPKKNYSKLAMELHNVYKQLPTSDEYAVKEFLGRCIKQALSSSPTSNLQTPISNIDGISKVHLKNPAAPLPAKLPLLIDDLYTAFASKKGQDIDPVNVLDGALPPVKGDEIIQIGITFGLYGAALKDDVEHRHIFVLGGCSSVTGATVHVCNNERELIVRWATFVGAMDPDVLVGYNIIGFDMEYIFRRAEELACQQQLLSLSSRLRYVASAYNETSLSSSALGDNVLKVIDMPGRVVMDLMKVVQRDHKLDSFKLDAVAEHFTGNKKNDVSPADIFRLQRGSDEDRAIIAAYCVQDCELVLRLAWRLEVMANNIGMANVCTVPLMYIFMRGQGIKIFSLVSKQCKLDNFLIPTAARLSSDQAAADVGYEGAIVLEPQAGIYMEPVSVLDYASLYPSSMISENLSHDSIVLDDKYANIPGVTYVAIEYDIYEHVGTSKVKVASKTCHFAQNVNGRKAVIPRILQELIGQRKATRKMALHKRVTFSDGSVVVGPMSGHTHITDSNGRIFPVTERDVVEEAYTDFQKAVLEGLQLAYKVTANSLYGTLGARTNQLYLKDLAACTTATGRSLILKAKAFVQKEFNARVIYGDSVAGYTPVLLRINSHTVIYETIDRLQARFGRSSWSTCAMEPGRETKSACELEGVEAWTEAGWTHVHRVIRHELAPSKSMVRVTTATAVVDVTDDHSLLRPNGDPVTPKSIMTGDALLHAPHPQWSSDGYPSLSVQEASIMGMFLGCRCDQEHGAKGFIHSYAMQVVESFMDQCTDAYPQIRWTISGPGREGLYILEPAPDQVFCQMGVFFNRFLTMMVSSGSFVVPQDVLASPSLRVKRAFLDGFHTSNPLCAMQSQLTAATVCALIEGLNATTPQQYVIAKDDRVDRSYQFKDRGLWHDADALGTVVSHHALPREKDGPTYVYDLTTGNNHFAAGVGKLIVHNTDSIFCIFKNVDEKTGEQLVGKDALRKSIETGIKASAAFKPHLKAPHDLEYEKTFFPFIILSKKRYVGNLYEHDTNKFDQKSMGIVLKRRDNANIVKVIYGGIIDIILNRQDVPASVAFLKTNLTHLVDGRSPIQELVITKSLRATYKDPEKIAHQVLAKRMGDRDEGNRPQANDRIPFVYIVNAKAVLQGERIEHPRYVQEKKLKIDYRFYIEHQIMKPVCQLYAIVLEQLPGYDKPTGFWKAQEKEWRAKYGGDVAKALEKVVALREKEAERLLFGRLLMDIDTESKGLRKMTAFFPRIP